MRLLWELQNKAIAAKRDAYLANGWVAVAILDQGETFRSWEYEKTSKKKGGYVFIAVSQRGEVEVFEGYRSHKDVKSTRRGEATDDAAPVADGRPAMSSTLQNYIDLHRHAAVRLALLGDAQVALRLMIAEAICGSPLWQVKAEPQSAKSNAIAGSIAASPAQDEFIRRRATIVSLLGLEDECGTMVQGGDEVVAANVFATLLKLPNVDVMRVVAMLAADTLASGSALVEAVGIQLKVDTARTWTPDDAFFELVREKHVVNAMLAEVASKAVADANVAERLKTQKKIIRDHLDGTNGRAKVAPWLPRWLPFPTRGYESLPRD